MSDARLYVDSQFTSPYAMSVFVALHEAKLPFDIETVDLGAGMNHAPAYANVSLTRRVPTLIHGDFSLAESSAITEYLNELFPAARLYPQEIKARAKARQIQAWLRSDLVPIRQERSTLVVFYGQKGQPLSVDAQRAADKLFAAAEALLPDGAEYVCGEWSLADVDLAVMLNRLALHGDQVPARLAAYAAHQWQRPSVQRWVNQTRPAL
ncbi:glutathione transferase [Pigmentiphaga aceris]|uniref:Glutathione transferase n=1 Tax=Pigmentiphaga aceris TaxID=1940612 RepID=A0A5C0B044_9BURK|nr:glutathione transferase [Pigmentiphaga aceris]QEI08092.1 glutathione transferase [Pigmentiphaga aceris]